MTITNYPNSSNINDNDDNDGAHKSRNRSTAGTTTATTTTTTTTRSMIVSAPGKILLAGGYLVLDEMNMGLVIGVTARLYSSCHISTTTTTVVAAAAAATATAPLPVASTATMIHVISPQFQQEWYYRWDHTTCTLHEAAAVESPPPPPPPVAVVVEGNATDHITPTTPKQRYTTTTTKNMKNQFLEKALRIVLLYISHPKNQSRYNLTGINSSNESSLSSSSSSPVSVSVSNTMTVRIVGDNDFYSLVPHLQSRGLDKTQIDQLPKCLPVVVVGTTNSDITVKEEGEGTATTIYKTGLGSSACLVTAVIGSIIHATTVQQQQPHNNDTTTDNRNTDSKNQIVDDDDDDDEYGIDNTPTPITTNVIIERLSQIGHCYGQGKVGSGFDVSAAMIGSHIYQRFSPEILQTVLSYLDQEVNTTIATTSVATAAAAAAVNTTIAITTDTTNTTSTIATTAIDDHVLLTMNSLYNVVHDGYAWKSCNVQPIACFSNSNNSNSKSFLQVMMADVIGGSESPSMAKQVLSWRNKYILERVENNNGQAPEDLHVPHWDDLVLINRQIVNTLKDIHAIVPTVVEEEDVIQQLYLDTPYDDWKLKIDTPLTHSLIALTELFVQQRFHMKQMGIVAGNVPIEPDIQTLLCNNVANDIPGVLASMVPGAGGYDAIVIIYINTTTTHRRISNYLATYSAQNVCALSVQGIPYNDGLRIETEFPI